jgi:hypothetical protein
MPAFRYSIFCVVFQIWPDFIVPALHFDARVFTFCVVFQIQPNSLVWALHIDARLSLPCSFVIFQIQSAFLVPVPGTTYRCSPFDNLFSVLYFKFSLTSLFMPCLTLARISLFFFLCCISILACSHCPVLAPHFGARNCSLIPVLCFRSSPLVPAPHFFNLFPMSYFRPGLPFLYWSCLSMLV